MRSINAYAQAKTSSPLFFPGTPEIENPSYIPISSHDTLSRAEQDDDEEFSLDYHCFKIVPDASTPTMATASPTNSNESALLHSMPSDRSSSLTEITSTDVSIKPVATLQSVPSTGASTIVTGATTICDDDEDPWAEFMEWANNGGAIILPNE
jgi:hypothetical protein